MIRLPSSHAAITAPLVASSSTFPGIPIGKSLLDARPFHLSPVLVEAATLPSTNSIALGGIGSGKSTTGKVRARREILHHGHQYVVIDSFGEDHTGEWGALTRAMGGRVIEAGTFTMNPCSQALPPEVREQLIRSLITAVEPSALTYQSTHALQHALNHPKANNLNGLVDALVQPEDGRWPAAKLTEWGEGVAIGLSRYTEGSLRGLFDGQDASLPPVDLPILTFDFSGLDRNSPAIPAMMAAVSVWAEHVWLRQSTAVHRHLVLEEAWQILLSPATAELIQRLLKNSRKAGLSLDVLMHTLSDQGDGRAQDLARLCEVAHIGRLNPEEAAIVGALLGLPDWAIAAIPQLDPGQAVWKVGPNFVDIIETIRDEEEARLTDTSIRRRAAQEALTDPDVSLVKAEDETEDEEWEEDSIFADMLRSDDIEPSDIGDWEMPGNGTDSRHYDAIDAARQGRFSEAAELAALGERQDIAQHGIMSDQAVTWMSTRAKVAELCGSPETATQLRATVSRMGKKVEWWSDDTTMTDADMSPAAHHVPPPAPLDPEIAGEPAPRRRSWPYVVAVAALALVTAAAWQQAADDRDAQKEAEQAASYKGVSAAEVEVDGVETHVLADWSKDGKSVILSVSVDPDEKAKMIRIDSGPQTAHEDVQPLKKGQIAMPIELEVKVPVEDQYQMVRLSVMVGGSHWKATTRAPQRTIELHPDRTAIDTDTGKRLTQQYSHL
ncbi:hypothetical protein [Streptomyces sp. NBC_00342]|uniref:hypothetical protein n=1 Tax=Streptomyces sp. NBC_00342 TaxID=2975718 RepID=UPI002E29E7FF|nr:hypothetical protein [Streptomyces sp. NBC_00342]